MTDKKKSSYHVESTMKRPYLLPCQKVLGTPIDAERQAQGLDPLCTHPHKLELTDDELKRCMEVKAFRALVDRRALVVT